MSQLNVNGYVHSLIDNNLTFEQFALQCARAFGWLGSMREDEMDAPIPDVIEPDGYHKRRIDSCMVRLEKLRTQSDEEFVEEQIEERKRINANIMTSRLQKVKELQILKTTLDRINEWNPPAEVQPLRSKMIEWITKPMQHEHAVELLDETIADVARVRRDLIFECEASLEYSRKHWEEDQRRAREATEWVRKLKGSLGLLESLK